jgi:hypothetical protein
MTEEKRKPRKRQRQNANRKSVAIRRTVIPANAIPNVAISAPVQRIRLVVRNRNVLQLQVVQVINKCLKRHLGHFLREVAFYFDILIRVEVIS